MQNDVNRKKANLKITILGYLTWGVFTLFVDKAKVQLANSFVHLGN